MHSPTRDINAPIAVPRGDQRRKLMEVGLVGKIDISAGWTAVDIEKEISSLFRDCFRVGQGQILSFCYLSMMPGAKKLCIPKTSASFTWGPVQVISSCTRETYIMAKQHPLRYPYKDNSDDTSGDSADECEDASSSPKSSRSKSENVGKSSCSQSIGGTSNTPNQGGLLKELGNSAGSAVNERVDCGSSTYRSYMSLLEDPVCISDEGDLEGLQEAIEESLKSKELEMNTPTKLPKDVLQEHVAKEMVVGSDDYGLTRKNLIKVRRKYVFEDGLLKLSKATFMDHRPLSVKFADDDGKSEGAVDSGGPTREFLRLAVSGMYDSSIFSGPASSKVLVLNQEAKRKNMYYLCGKLVAISLCNGGGVGNCLAKCIFDFVAYGDENTSPGVEDIQDPCVKTVLKKLTESETETTFREVTLSDETLNCFSQAGWTGIPCFTNKERLIKDLCHFFVIDKVRVGLEQFKDGLSTLNILPLVQAHPKAFEDVFCYKASRQCLSAEIFNQMFTPQYEEDGTRLRDKQEMIVMHWRDYLQDCEDGTSGVSLSEILIFATGCDQIPPLDFNPKPTIQFWEDVRPKSSTCANILFLPLHPNCPDVQYDAFRLYMDEGILNSPTFGIV